MPAASLRHGVRYGFDSQDVKQEFDLGKTLSFRRRPGDDFAAFQRGKTRAARYKKRECEYNEIRVSLDELTVRPGSTEKIEPVSAPDLQFEKALAREIMDLLPYTEREDVLKALLEGDGREMRRIGRMMRKRFPKLLEEDS